MIRVLTPLAPDSAARMRRSQPQRCRRLREVISFSGTPAACRDNRAGGSVRNFLLAIAAFIAQAQTAAGPSFEVASLKLTEHGRDATGWSDSSLHEAPGNLTATNESLQGLIQFAYNVNQYQIVAPEWLSSDNASYDIVAKAPPDTTLDQMRQMMQTLP